MSYWVVQSFAVADPAERLAAVRNSLTIDDFLGVVDTAADDRGESTSSDDVRHEVLALVTDRLVPPDVNSAYGIWTDEAALFVPYADLILEPGEYACVLGVSDTSDEGTGHVYAKRADGTVEIVDAVTGGEGGTGRYAADACEDSFGFRPHTGPRSSIRGHMLDRGDPFPRYRSVLKLESLLVDDDPFHHVGTDARPCPTCGHEDLSGPDQYVNDEYLTAWRCERCRDRHLVYDPADFLVPGEGCPACGGETAERAVQYPSIASTAHECRDCGEVSFDTLSIPEDRLHPKPRRPDAVGPDVAADRERRGLDPDEEE